MQTVKPTAITNELAADILPLSHLHTTLSHSTRQLTNPNPNTTPIPINSKPESLLNAMMQTPNVSVNAMTLFVIF